MEIDAKWDAVKFGTLLDSKSPFNLNSIGLKIPVVSIFEENFNPPKMSEFWESENVKRIIQKINCSPNSGWQKLLDFKIQIYKIIF